MSTPSGYGKSLSNQCAASSRSAAFEEFHLIHSFCIIVCDEIAQSTAQTSLKFLFEMGKSLLICLPLLRKTRFGSITSDSN